MQKAPQLELFASTLEQKTLSIKTKKLNLAIKRHNETNQSPSSSSLAENIYPTPLS